MEPQNRRHVCLAVAHGSHEPRREQIQPPHCRHEIISWLIFTFLYGTTVLQRVLAARNEGCI